MIFTSLGPHKLTFPPYYLQVQNITALITGDHKQVCQQGAQWAGQQGDQSSEQVLCADCYTKEHRTFCSAEVDFLLRLMFHSTCEQIKQAVKTFHQEANIY